MERDPIKHLYNVYVKINKDLQEEKGEAEKKDFKAAAPQPDAAQVPAAKATEPGTKAEEEEEEKEIDEAISNIELEHSIDDAPEATEEGISLQPLTDDTDDDADSDDSAALGDEPAEPNE